ncbi:prolyl-tRNA synthetase associated domain-containing protein [Oricola cellulosilytica]|nr:prolyl-tRNA synthetase associated domain-containing protein [Oricola cellulosilytica]
MTAASENPRHDPLTRDDLSAFLGELGIEAPTRDHPPVFTVEESKSLRDAIPGGHTKNLFLKDKKGRHFLLTVGEDAVIDLKTIHGLIGASGRVSFGKPEQMMDYLGVVPGAVTAFGVINDRDGAVTLIFDEELMAHDVINAHPLTNAATTSIRTSDMKRFVEATGHSFNVLNLSSQGAT